jgi:hypothetical protein
LFLATIYLILSFANEKISPILLQAVTVKPFEVAAICGPLVCEAASFGRMEIKEGAENVLPDQKNSSTSILSPFPYTR